MVIAVGFAIDFDGRNVLLVQKTHPDWQAGKFNGIGGKVENGEMVGAAMVREFKEETLSRLPGSPLYVFKDPAGWKHFVTLCGDGWQCAFFEARANLTDLQSLDGVVNDDGETMHCVEIADLWRHPCVPNIRWLIHFALCHAEYSGKHLPLVLSEATQGGIVNAGRRGR